MQQTKECVYVNVLFVNVTIYFAKKYDTKNQPNTSWTCTTGAVIHFDDAIILLNSRIIPLWEPNGIISFSLSTNLFPGCWLDHLESGIQISGIIIFNVSIIW